MYGEGAEPKISAPLTDGEHVAVPDTARTGRRRVEFARGPPGVDPDHPFDIASPNPGAPVPLRDGRELLATQHSRECLHDSPSHREAVRIVMGRFR